MESSIRPFLKKLANSLQTIAQVTEVIIDSSASIVPPAALAKLKQRKYTDEKAKIEKHYRQHIETVMKL